MTRDDITKLAREHGKPVQEQNAEVEYLFTLDGVEALLAAEREACASFLERGVDMKHLNNDPAWSRYYGRYTVDLLMGCAAVIRQRGQA